MSVHSVHSRLMTSGRCIQSDQFDLSVPRNASCVYQCGESFPKSRAVSTGRCNTGLQFTRRRFKAQSLSRALIEAQSCLVEIGLSVTGQVGFLREVLS